MIKFSATVSLCFLSLFGCSSASKVEEMTKADPYLWLEEVSSPKSLDWVKGQNSKTILRFGESKDFKNIRNQILNVLQAEDRIAFVFEQNGYLYNFWQDKKNVAGLLRRTTVDNYENDRSKWENVFDLDQWNLKEKKKWVWKGLHCFAQTNKCLMRLSLGGGDAVWTKEFDLGTKSFLKDGFELPIAKSQVDWWDQDTLIVGTDFGVGSLTDSGYPRIMKFWKRGQMLEEARVLIEGQKQDVDVSADVFEHQDQRTLLLARNVSFFQSLKYLIGDDGLPIEMGIPNDADVVGLFKGQLLVKLKSDWKTRGSTYTSGSLISIPKGLGAASLIYQPNSRQVIENVRVSKSRVLMTVLDNVEGILIAANWEDQKWSTKNIEVPPTGSINIVTSQPHSDTAYVTYESYLNPTTLFKVDNAQLKRIRQLPEKFNPENLVAEKKESVSADGTKIPFVVVHPKNQKGPLPTLLFGYGGFEISLAPSYYATVGKVWLDRGFAFAVANIRGGGEFGPNWHKAALKNQRAKAFEDFESVAEQLIKLKVTSSRLLAIRGGSNGGLLVGASMLRRPELYAAVICEVPLLDMIRYHRLLAGASWMEEYGNPDQSRDFKYLLSYSPYQNIRSVKYPEPFLFTSTMDDRVHPGHARKFVAKLLSEGHPVTYYENLEGGHARAADLQQLSFVQALQYSYLLQKLTQ